MSFRITDDCLNCGACESECPSGAIFEGENIYIIDQSKCTQCGSCVDVCPNEAIIEE